MKKNSKTMIIGTFIATLKLKSSAAKNLVDSIKNSKSGAVTLNKKFTPTNEKAHAKILST
jgi:hypothetical protein